MADLWAWIGQTARRWAVDPLALAGGLATVAVLALALLLLWAFGQGAGLGWAAFAVVLPVALIWLAVSFGQQIALLRAEAAELRAELARRRVGDLSGQSRRRSDPSPQDKAEPQAHPTRSGNHPEAAPESANPQPTPPKAGRGPNASPASRPPRQAAEPQEAAPQEPLPLTDLLRALHFPNGPDDVEAVRALRAALRDPVLSRLIRAGQDVVTLLAERGIYMDAIPPEGADYPDLWRRFAQGERGAAVLAMAKGVPDEDIETTRQIWAQDAVFRDVAQHFLRQFDRMLGAMAPVLDDDILAALAETRSARAFALLARASGILG